MFKFTKNQDGESRVVLVYQAGVANVFEVDCFNMRASGRSFTKRIKLGSFRECETYCQGLSDSGIIVKTVGCNQPGDISGLNWTENLEQLPFHDEFRPVDSDEKDE